jgi:hypothetical protein
MAGVYATALLVAAPALAGRDFQGLQGLVLLKESALLEYKSLASQ